MDINHLFLLADPGFDLAGGVTLSGGHYNLKQFSFSGA